MAPPFKSASRIGPFGSHVIPPHLRRYGERPRYVSTDTHQALHLGQSDMFPNGSKLDPIRDAVGHRALRGVRNVYRGLLVILLPIAFATSGLLPDDKRRHVRGRDRNAHRVCTRALHGIQKVFLRLVVLLSVAFATDAVASEKIPCVAGWVRGVAEKWKAWREGELHG